MALGSSVRAARCFASAESDTSAPCAAASSSFAERIAMRAEVGRPTRKQRLRSPRASTPGVASVPAASHERPTRLTPPSDGPSWGSLVHASRVRRLGRQLAPMGRAVELGSPRATSPNDHRAIDTHLVEASTDPRASLRLPCLDVRRIRTTIRKVTGATEDAACREVDVRRGLLSHVKRGRCA
jgi:hypothetical protein